MFSWEDIKAEFRELKAAWKSAAIVTVAFMGLTWLAAGQFYEERIAVKDAQISERDGRIAAKDARIAELNDQLQAKLQIAEKSDDEVKLRWATREELKGSYIRGVAVRVADLIDPAGQPLIQHRQFENCEIVGPAIFAWLPGNKITGSKFSGALSGDPDSILWSVPDGSTKVGSVGLADTAFDNCRFLGIGFAAPDATLERFRRDLQRNNAQRNNQK